MPTSAPKQLILGICPDDDATFANFLVSAENQQAYEYLISDPEEAGVRGQRERYIYLWGAPGSGKTHLLQAICNMHTVSKTSSFYLPLGNSDELTPEILQGTNSLSLVCIDDLHLVLGDSSWEDALFHAFNAWRENGTQLVFTANSSPMELQTKLPDLHSRLNSGLVFQLKQLSDTDKLLALRLRAENRGMILPTAVAEFILLRADRNFTTLMDILDRLDEKSLQEQRKLSIPLVKAALDW